MKRYTINSNHALSIQQSFISILNLSSKPQSSWCNTSFSLIFLAKDAALVAWSRLLCWADAMAFSQRVFFNVSIVVGNGATWGNQKKNKNNIFYVKGVINGTRNLASLYDGVFIAERMGRKEGHRSVTGLWTLVSGFYLAPLLIVFVANVASFVLKSDLIMRLEISDLLANSSSFILASSMALLIISSNVFSLHFWCFSVRIFFFY